MKFSLIILSIFVGFVSFLSNDNSLPKNEPLFLDLEVNVKDAASSSLIFSVDGTDSTVVHDIYLLYDLDSMAMLYYADILTPVCIDGNCKPLYLELYWNLLGEYAGYGVYEDELLSKYDHDLFEKEDYSQLDDLLNNPHSILERKKLTDLYDSTVKRDKSIKFKGKQVDGITGATVREIKEEVVDGALFSCYTLWHLVHGIVKSKISTNLTNITDERLQESFLNSSHSSYQLHAIKQFTADDYEMNMNQVINVLNAASPLDRGWILKKMPKSCFAATEFVDDIYQEFGKYDGNTRTLLIRNIKSSTSRAQEYLSADLQEMSKNQLKLYLASLDLAEGSVLRNLKNFSIDATSTNGYIVKEFLERKGEK